MDNCAREDKNRAKHAVENTNLIAKEAEIAERLLKGRSVPHSIQ